MSDKKLTPMMELIEWIDNSLKNENQVIENQDDYHPLDVKQAKLTFNTVMLIRGKIEMQLKKERQMVIDAYHNGQKQVVVTINKRYDLSNTMKEIEKIDNGLEPNEEAEEYYNETFKTK